MCTTKAYGKSFGVGIYSMYVQRRYVQEDSQTSKAPKKITRDIYINFILLLFIFFYKTTKKGEENIINEFNDSIVL